MRRTSASPALRPASRTRSTTNTGEQRYAFQLFRESFVEFDVTRIGGRQIAFKPELFGSNGMPVDSFRPAAHASTFAAGGCRPASTSSGSRRRSAAATTSSSPAAPRACRRCSNSSLSAASPAVSTIGWWRAADQQQPRLLRLHPGGRGFAVGLAGAAPLHLAGDQRRPEGAGDRPFHRRRDPLLRRREGRIRGSGRRDAGAQRRRGERHAATRRREREGENILDRESVRGYTQGSSILVEGKTADGQPAQVRYSLYGYRSAINAAAIACGRPDLAQDLVWRR